MTRLLEASLILALLCGCGAEAPYLVRRVIDGDTFEVEGPGGARMRCRLRRGDAPERGEPGFEQAKAALESRLLGRRVRLRVHARDSYGRAIVTIEPRL